MYHLSISSFPLDDKFQGRAWEQMEGSEHTLMQTMKQGIHSGEISLSFIEVANLTLDHDVE